MIRSAARFFLFYVSAVLLTGLFLPAARGDGPTLTAKFGIAGRYRPGGWCLVSVGVQNPSADSLSGQIQILTANDNGRSRYGRPSRQNAPSVVFACPVSIPGGSAAVHSFPLYLRGIDPGQADVTVQLVEGRERGDGRVLAAINNQNQNDSQAFTGGPIGTNDYLMVGFGGDPGAFTFLNSRRLPLPMAAPPPPNQYNPNGVNMGMPATVQVAEAATAADLPDKAAGYDGVSSFLLRSDAPVEGMTEAQNNALRGWVAAGGHLIVCGGPDPTRFGSAFFDGLLPATLSSTEGVSPMRLTPKPLPGVHSIQNGPKGPLIVSGPFGAGTVTVTAFDPTASAFQSAGTFGLSSTWQTLIDSRPAPTASVLGMTAAREENYNAVYYGSSPPLLSEAVMRGPSLDAPGTSVIAVFLLVYLIVLVPVNYLVLKRFDRKELAWATIPLLVFIFAAGTFGVGYAAKGGAVFVNRAALIETSAGRQEAGVYSELGLFSPHRTNYDIALSGDNLVGAVPNPGMDYGSQSGDDSQFTGPAQFVETPSGVSLVNTPVNMWAMRAFDAQSTINLGGTIDGALADNFSVVTGRIVNHTAYALTDCEVLYGGRWLSLGTLAPGATLSMPTSLSGSVPQTAFPASGKAVDSESDIHDRMHAALGDYFQSLIQSQNNSNSYGTPPPIYVPLPGEALFTGWSSDPKLAGPTPHVDGQPVTENDVTLVIVHLPVSGAPQPAKVVLQPVSSQGASSMHLGFSPYSFASIARSSSDYRRALDTRSFGTNANSKSMGHVVRLRGVVSTFIQQPAPQGVILDFEPDVSQQGLTALLPFSSGRRDPAVLGLLGHEVVITGILTQTKAMPPFPGAAQPGKAQVIVSQPSQVQVVH